MSNEKCPDCGHPILWDGDANHIRHYHPKRSGGLGGCFVDGCKCENTQEQCIAKLVIQTRLSTLLDAARVCCYNCRTGVYKLKLSDDLLFHVRADGERVARCDAWPIHALLAQEPEVPNA